MHLTAIVERFNKDYFTMSVCIVSFSSRKNGNCAQIGEFIGALIPSAKLYAFSDFQISACGNCSYQCFGGGEKCPFIADKERKILDAVTNSTFTYFVVPSYCDFPCANFFVFNERSLCYFQNNEKLLTAYLQVPKKFVVVTNGSVKNFKTAFSYHTDVEPQILCLSAKKYEKNSIDGNLLTSERAMDDLRKFIIE